MVPEILHVEIPEEYQQKPTSTKQLPKRKLPSRKNESAPFNAAMNTSVTLDSNENYWTVKSKTANDNHRSKNTENEGASTNFDTLLAQTLKDYDEESQNTDKTKSTSSLSSKNVSNFETESDW